MQTGYYQTVFVAATAEGLPEAAAAERAAHAFLDGKPAQSSATQRQAAFWASAFVRDLSAETWVTEPLVLALARYLAQDTWADAAVLAHVAALAPEAVRRAARCSGLVERADSPRSRELEALGDTLPEAFAAFIRIIGMLRKERARRIAIVERCRKPLAGQTPLGLLAYISLYAFAHLMPPAVGGRGQCEDVEAVWNAIESTLAWKLGTCALAALKPSEKDIGKVLGAHLSPFLFPSKQGRPPRRDLYDALAALLVAQMALDEFNADFIEAFNYDEGSEFVQIGERLERMERQPAFRAARHMENKKLLRLGNYWLHRGMDALMASPELLARVDPAHEDANLQAMTKAMSSWLYLQEVYGVGTALTTDAGAHVDVFHALMAVELMTAFYIEDFLRAYMQRLQVWGVPWLALGQLALGGMMQGENRLPVTWSLPEQKIARITPWTASHEHPQGNAEAARAIVDFWTSDWSALAERLRSGKVGLLPRLQERSFLKMGGYLFQLPWMVAQQNNRFAAINNLRRLGARRAQAREETRNIEKRLGEAFARRGFRVCVGRVLAPVAEGAGGEEIDLLCARDGHVLVLELKSTFMRRSLKEAWLHRSTTLRGAGLQLQRKLAAVWQGLNRGDAALQSLGVAASVVVTGWIVDTSIECDHQRFSGFLKVSLEEVLIALRDERHLLRDIFRPDGAVVGVDVLTETARFSLYPDGFSAERFVHVIEAGETWRGEV